MNINKITPSENSDYYNKKVKRFWKSYIGMGLVGILVMGLTVVATLVISGVIDLKAMGKTLVSPIAKVVDNRQILEGESEYSAVFLSSNQVYFGKLKDEKAQYISLVDVYYLRAQSRLQPPEEDEGRGQVKQEVQLIKLGNELHGPVDEIRFNRDNILFIESLKKDSRVVRGIEQFKAQQN